MDSTQTSKAVLSNSKETSQKHRKKPVADHSDLDRSSPQLAPAHLERATSWSSKRNSRIDQAKLQQLRAAVESLQEVPEIDPASRAIADLLWDAEEVRPRLCIQSQHSSPVKASPNEHRIKNSLKRLNQPGPVHLDVKVFKGCLSVCASPACSSPALPKAATVDERMRSLKQRMDLIPPPPHEPARRQTGTSLFDRTTSWKRHSQEKVTAELLRKQAEELSECTFKPRTGKHRKVAKPSKTHHSHHSSQKKYAALSPAATSIGFSTGFNMQQFRTKAKALVDYKLFAAKQSPK